MNLRVDQNTWPTWSRNVAWPALPEEYVEASVDRLMDKIHPYMVDVKNVRPQFNSINSVRMIHFETAAEKKYYDDAMNRYLEAVGKLEAEGGANSKFMILVEWLKFRQAAEFCRCNYMAYQMYNSVAEGYAAIAALCFKPSQAKIAYILNSKFGVPRNQISMIWGGSQAFAGKTERIPADEIVRILTAAMHGETIEKSMMKRIKQQLVFDSEGLGALPPELDLGPQDYVKRQVEIDRFQTGKALYCLFNFKSGGVGLSLHHSDDMTKEKVRRKKGSGYAYVEDIPLIPTRPRICYLTPTFSAIELVQGLGRAARLTSLSDTLQIMLFYRGTIEEKVAAAVSQKLKCLKKVVRQRESWEDIISARGKAYADAAPAPVIPDEEKMDGSELFDLDDTESDEEDENENED